MRRRILVIENQVVQHSILEERLHAYDVYPVIGEDYDSVMDWVRIYLNGRYRQMRKEDVFEKLVNYIREHQIELVVMDYKLSGSYDGGTGILLATKLQGRKRFPGMPMVFLSSTPRNNQTVQKDLAVVENYEWVEKGYAGVGLLQEEYVDRQIIPKIEQLLKPIQQRDISSILRDIDVLTKKDSLENFIDRLLKLKDLIRIHGISEADESFIKELQAKANFGETYIEEIFKKYGN